MLNNYSAPAFALPPADKALTLNPDAQEFVPGHSPTDSPEFGYTKEEPATQPFAGPAMAFITTQHPTPTLVPAQAPQIEPQPLFTPISPEVFQIAGNVMPPAPQPVLPPPHMLQNCGGYHDLTMQEVMGICSVYGPHSIGSPMPHSKIFQRPESASRDEVRDVLREMKLPWTIANHIAALLPDVYTVPLLIYNRFDQLTRTFTIYLNSDEPFPATHELWNSLSALPPATFPTFWNSPDIANNNVAGMQPMSCFHRPQNNTTQPLVGNMQVLRPTTEMQIFKSKGPKTKTPCNSGFKHVMQMTLLGGLDLTPLPADCHGHIPNEQLIDHSDVLVIKLGKTGSFVPPIPISPQIYATSPQIQYVGTPNANTPPFVATPQSTQAFVPAPTIPFQQISI